MKKSYLKNVFLIELNTVLTKILVNNEIKYASLFEQILDKHHVVQRFFFGLVLSSVCF